MPESGVQQRSRGAAKASPDPATRERIDAAVLEIFSGREFHHVHLIEIARTANVSLQTLYKYYGSKEALLFSTIETWMGRMAARVIDHLQGIESFQDRLRKVFWVVLDFFEKNPRVVQLLLSSVYTNTWKAEASYQQPVMMQLFLHELSEGQARGLLTREVDVKTLLDYILGVMGRVVLMWVQRGQKEPLAARSLVLFAMLWRAIAAPADEIAGR